MTDLRNDAALEKSIGTLPQRSGVVFRHYHLGAAARQTRFNEIREACNLRSHVLLLADRPEKAIAWGADGFHGRQPLNEHKFLHSAPVHNDGEVKIANQFRPDLYFLSPVHPTRSHPREPPLERERVKKLIKMCDGPVIVMGGMNADRFPEFAKLGAYGWAAIDALSIS